MTPVGSGDTIVKLGRPVVRRDNSVILRFGYGERLIGHVQRKGSVWFPRDENDRLIGYSYSTRRDAVSRLVAYARGVS